MGMEVEVFSEWMWSGNYESDMNHIIHPKIKSMILDGWEIKSTITFTEPLPHYKIYMTIIFTRNG